MITPIVPGAQRPHCQPYNLAAVPAMIGAKNPPMLCATFHMPQYVPRSLDENHDVKMRAHPGAPSPCSIPLIDQNTENQIIEVEKPNATFIAAVAMSPPASRRRGEVLEPSTPDTNLDMPYMMGKMLVSVPMSLMVMPNVASATMAGAVYVRELRVR